jgi:uncharacterized membrane protein
VISFDQFIERASVGPVPGELILAVGMVYVLCFAYLARSVSRTDAANVKQRNTSNALG